MSFEAIIFSTNANGRLRLSEQVSKLIEILKNRVSSPC
jgi:hypothetical protein